MIKQSIRYLIFLLVFNAFGASKEVTLKQVKKDIAQLQKDVGRIGISNQAIKIDYLAINKELARVGCAPLKAGVIGFPPYRGNWTK